MPFTQKSTAMPGPPNLGRPWQEIAAEARAHRAATLAAVGPPELPAQLPRNVTSVPPEVLTPREVEITATPAEALVARLASGEWAAAEVAGAFLRRAAVAQLLTNCLTELLPERALERARQLDEHLRRHGAPVGPLHGLPVSVKEHVGMRGLGLDSAYCALYGHVVDDDAVILRVLWRAGAVFYARSAEPQLLMHLETDSNLYGPTRNPHNTALTSGGSSGGEGALIALGGSVLGIGTDIGGSIRSPAGNCGIYGLRPTSQRFPLLGSSGSEGWEGILGVIGPLSSSIEGIKLFCKTIIDAHPWLLEPRLLPMPWAGATDLLPPKLRVAVLWDDGFVRPHPPVLRALRETVARLARAADVEVSEWVPYRHDEAWRLIVPLYFPDGGREQRELIDGSGEPWLPLSKFILKDNPLVREMDVADVTDFTTRRDAYRTAHAAHWNATATRYDAQGLPLDAVDVILCPVGPGAAPPLDCARYWCYTSQWNLVDYPALVFPVTKVDQKLDVKEEGYQPRNEMDEYNYKLYTPETYVDAPVSLQLVGRRYEDEKVIQAFERIKSYL